ncbi:MAG: hypothetical protein OQJ99_03540 [Rhodospirillales bacterium]|nr:hypothetical protein [Rhodospirillales bacterium]MCW8861957.1 hypothetical protein [Rhodospirillales bacterium]MCW8952709.1 hypothetical protein [Rhodospirillales bacterium]MCW8969615.1 hypothetical protein [Rhodospirillales bacterium]MCW9002987.1 hypothetical protein [Rhodospirillales bacterium]
MFEKYVEEMGLDTPYAVISRLTRFENDWVLGLEHDGSPKYVRRPSLGIASKQGNAPTNKSWVTVETVEGVYYPALTYKGIGPFLLDITDARPFDAIVEFGSGYGKNLINLYSGGGPRGIPYFAAEFTEAGRDACSYLAGLDAAFDLRSVPFDFNAPDLSFLDGFNRVLAFSNHAIEQVEEIGLEFFELLASEDRDVYCLHAEPFGFTMKEHWGKPSEKQEEGARAMGFNVNLLARLNEAAEKGIIASLYVAKEVLGGDPTNPTSVAIWTNR